MLKKINALIQEIQRSPYWGIEKPLHLPLNLLHYLYIYATKRRRLS
jgi:Txe/YoeB family toxin of Txe-Axe toxin-antitoxin module